MNILSAVLAGFFVSMCAGFIEGVLQGRLIQGPICFKKRSGTCCRRSEIGQCFSRSDPSVFLYLFTSQSETDPEFLHECGGKLPVHSTFDPNAETEIFVHGWLDGPCRTAVWREMRDQLFIRGKYNVILVDWTKYNTPDLKNAGLAVKPVAGIVACVIKNIMREKKITGENLHLVGHSYGAHIAGIIGKIIRKETGCVIRRITGLDPAGFRNVQLPPSEKLDRSDAKLVDVIHSNDGCMPDFGYRKPIGLADFYPNGGSVQLSCVPYIIYSFLKLDVLLALFTLLPNFCYHLQSLQYYKVSINSCTNEFVGVKCDSYKSFQAGLCKSCNEDGSNCGVMGMNWEYYYIPPNNNTTHNYFLTTTLQCPYIDNSNIQLNGFPQNTKTKDPGENCFPDKKIGGIF